MEILAPKSQLNLFGYDKLFNSFISLYEKNKLPNLMLLSGPKGLGKSTFAYHFINYLLSHDEQNKYFIKDFKISSENSSFKLIQNGIHPNFFLLGDDLNDGNIKIDKTRDLLKFLNKTTYSKNLKIVLIDNAEYLNLNSANALLKSLEEPPNNTFFFIIHNEATAILETIKSRCIKFKFHFNISEKKEVFNEIIQNYQLSFVDVNLEKFFHLETPGNLLKYLAILKDSNLNIQKDSLPCISFLFDKYKTKKDFELLHLISLLIENFYNELCLNSNNNLLNYLANKNKITHLINNMKKFNLDKKNLFVTILGILKNET